LNDKKVVECVEYFESNATLRKILDGFVKKFASLGCVGGNVVLEKLGKDDIENLEGLFNKNYHGMKNTSISAARLQEVIDRSRFAGVTIIEVLRYYYKAPLKSNREEVAERSQAEQEFFQEILKGYQGSFAADWLFAVTLDNALLYRVMVQKYRMDKERLKEMLLYVMVALNELPIHTNSYDYLAVFATKITGNPHYFDDKSESNYLLWQGILYYYENMGSKQLTTLEHLFHLDQKKEILYQVGLIRDEISNSTIVYGIQAMKKNGEPHKGLEGFHIEKEPVQLSLLTISELEKVWCYSNRIYVVENPSVFASILKVAGEKCSVLCVSGQPCLASLVLLDKIVIQGATIYYSGDCDPEGLCIADRLKLRYGSNLALWLMEERYYIQSISNKEISERRLKMLDGLQDDVLKEIAQRMRHEKRAGYQEKIMGEHLDHITGLGVK